MTSTIVIANDRQMAAIMAGLRLIERELPRGKFLPQGVHEIFDAGATIAPLNETEIDDLCDSIAMTEPAFVAADEFAGDVFYFNTMTGWDSDVGAAKQYSFSDLLTAHLPDGAGPRWVPISDLVQEPYRDSFHTREQIDALGAAAIYGAAGHEFQCLRARLPARAA